MMLRRSVRSNALVALVGLAGLVGVAGLGGCSSDGDDSAPTTVAETTTTAEAATTTAAGATTTEASTPAGTEPEAEPTETSTPAATTTAPSSGAAPTVDEATVDLFTDLRTDHCTGPTPEPIGTEETPDGQLVMVDNEGNRLVVDASSGTVTGLDGAEGELPAAYATSCDPDVFVGSSD